MEYDKNRNVYRRFIDGILSRLFLSFETFPDVGRTNRECSRRERGQCGIKPQLQVVSSG